MSGKIILVLISFIFVVSFVIHKDLERKKDEKNARANYSKFISKIKYKIHYENNIIVCDNRAFGEVEERSGKYSETKRSGSISFSSCDDKKKYTLLNYSMKDSCVIPCLELQPKKNELSSVVKKIENRINCIKTCFKNESHNSNETYFIEYFNL